MARAVGQPTKAEDHVYIVYHKPVGIVCTTDQKRERDNIIDAIGHERRIFPVGRLDKPSEGLIFLTSDGDVVNKILRARNHHEKEYHVVVDRPIRGSFIEDMAGGVPILGHGNAPVRGGANGSTAFPDCLDPRTQPSNSPHVRAPRLRSCAAEAGAHHAHAFGPAARRVAGFHTLRSSRNCKVWCPTRAKQR